MVRLTRIYTGGGANAAIGVARIQNDQLDLGWRP